MASDRKIILQANDAPTYKELVDTSSRLRKDYSILFNRKGKRDIEDPNSFKRVSGFLEMLAIREKRNLPKEESGTNSTRDVLMQMLSDDLKDISKEEILDLLQKSDLGKIFTKELFEEKDGSDDSIDSLNL